MGCGSSRSEQAAKLLQKSNRNTKPTDDRLSLRSYNSDANGRNENDGYDSDDALFETTKIPVLAFNPSQTKKYLIKLRDTPEPIKLKDGPDPGKSIIKRRRRSKKSKSLPLDLADDPPPNPPKTKKRDIIPDLSMFQQIDNYALKVPKSSEITVETLADHLVKPTKSDLEKVRVFYRWITNNISHDTDSVFKGRKRPVDPESVLRLKTSVCAGYTNLFEQLCRYSSIRCRSIHGFAKGYGFTHDRPFTTTDRTNHTWNVVFIEGDWRFVECTWGAGNIDSNKKFIWAYKEFYFLTDPEHLISSHFPYKNDIGGSDDLWQLVENPTDLWGFNKAIKPHPRSYAWNVEFVSHKNAFIEVKREVIIVIRGQGPYLVEVGSQLVEKDGTTIRKYSMVQKIDDQNTFEITVHPPELKTYVFRILGTTDPNDNEINTLIEYTVKCVEVETNLKPFPAHFGSWGPVHNYLEYGFCDNIPKGTFLSENGEISFSLETNKYVDAISRLIYCDSNTIDLDNCTLLETEPKQLFIKVRMPRDGFYKLRISCKNEDGNYKQVINYLIDCRKPLKVCSPFPKILKAAREFNCRLLQPLNFQLPANTEVQFKLESSALQKTVVRRQPMVNDGTNGIWEIKMIMPGVGERFMISGSASTNGELKNLYEFVIV